MGRGAVRVAYADPPYPGMAHYYSEKKEVNHRVLLGYLCDQYPDGWALSTASTTLRAVLALDTMPPDARIGSWVKTFASYKPGVNPGYAWEPVIFWRGRQKRPRTEPTVADWIACKITIEKGLTGVKPLPVFFWIFQMLGIGPGDEFHDVFPGSRAGERAWSSYVNQLALVVAS